MEIWQQSIIVLFGLGAFIGFIKSFDECKRKKRSLSLTLQIGPLYGAFVYADLVVFGLFWTIASLGAFFLNDWYLFLLTLSLFWLVRSIGETIYWFLQQFSTINRNPPEKFYIHKIFHNDSVWFVYQIFWQCITVITIITSIYLAKLWLNHI
jgi:hypothetical protein